MLDILLNVDPLLKLKIALVELPQFHAGLFHSEELDLIGQVYLRSLTQGSMRGRLPTLASEVCARHLTSVTDGSLQQAQPETALLQLQVIMTHQIYVLRPVEVPD